MIHIYAAQEGIESATALVERIKSLRAPVKLQRRGEFEKDRGDLCVNWGTSHARSFGNKARWLNKNVYVDKLDHLRRFQEARVPTVEFTVGDRPTRGQWYARRTVHRDGSDLGQDLARGDFYVRHVDIIEEYRVHVFRGEILRASRKVLMPGFRMTKFRCGDAWGFSNRNWMGDIDRALLEASRGAVEALGYDFGGVDVAETREGPVVFEVNSAPWLGGEMQGAYAGRIIQIHTN